MGRYDNTILLNDRDKNLDTLRGIACVLLVFYHVVGVDPSSGLRLPWDSRFHAFNEQLAYVRMPLFTFLSGIVYALRPVSRGAGRHFAEGKLKRLFVPFIVVSLIFAIGQKLVPGTNSNLPWAQIPLVVIWPYAHLWFIAGLLLVFALVGTLDYFAALDKSLHMFVLFAAASVLFEWRYGSAGVLGWNRALYLLPFFVAGVATKRFGWQSGLSYALIALLLPGWELSLGVGFGVMLLVLVPSIPLVGRIGVYSYSIYLFHVCGTASIRIASERLGVFDIPFLLLFGTLAGLLVPIAIHFAFERVPYVSRALLGVGPKAIQTDPTIRSTEPVAS